jgi:hypothetical protein
MADVFKLAELMERVLAGAAFSDLTADASAALTELRLGLAARLPAPAETAGAKRYTVTGSAHFVNGFEWSIAARNADDAARTAEIMARGMGVAEWDEDGIRLDEVRVQSVEELEG